MAEGEQEVYIRSARTKVGASGRAKERRAGCGPEKSSRAYAARMPAFTYVCVSIYNM